MTVELTEDQMELRRNCLRILRHKYPDRNLSLYKCADDWWQQGIAHTSGLIKYYETYYGP